MNPTVENVFAVFTAVPHKDPTEIWIDTVGINFPVDDHFQGIQRLSGERQLLVMTHSGQQQGYFVAAAVEEQDVTGRAFSPVTMGRKPFFTHAGGCQSYGNFLVVGLEDDDGKTTSEIQFWDFNRFPVQLIPMTIPRTGAELVSTAGAVGITSSENGNGGIVLAVATWNAGTVDFYTSDADPFAGSPFTLEFTWTFEGADMSNWIDQNWAHYQSVNLITETFTNDVFMVAFHRDDQARDWMDLYQVDLTKRQLTKRAKKHMTCTNGCNFNAGAGIFITSRFGFEVLAVSYYVDDNDLIAVNRFSAIAP